MGFPLTHHVSSASVPLFDYAAAQETPKTTKYSRKSGPRARLHSQARGCIYFSFTLNKTKKKRGEVPECPPGHGLKFFFLILSRRPRRSRRDFYCVYDVNSAAGTDSGFISLRLHGYIRATEANNSIQASVPCCFP